MDRCLSLSLIARGFLVMSSSAQTTHGAFHDLPLLHAR